MSNVRLGKRTFLYHKRYKFTQSFPHDICRKNNRIVLAILYQLHYTVQLQVKFCDVLQYISSGEAAPPTAELRWPVERT